MLYPYNHQFILYDDIKESLSGFGRIIEFRTYSKNREGNLDPSFAEVKKNWIMNIKEG
jgi:hypothetical protein